MFNTEFLSERERSILRWSSSSERVHSPVSHALGLDKEIARHVMELLITISTLRAQDYARLLAVQKQAELDAAMAAASTGVRRRRANKREQDR